jgi:ATP-dependent DNA helicase PIF1
MPGLLLPSGIHKSRNTKYFKNIDTIIIDEISMVRADLLDNIDFTLRLNRNSPLPFGGVQMIFFGDLFQIPPVVSNNAEKSFILQNYESPYFFSSNIFKSFNNFIYSELKEVFRQTDRLFINLLESIRTNEMDWEQLQELNQRYQPEFINEGNYITLSSRNSIANELNNRKLEQIDSPVFLYQSIVEGEFPPSIFPVDHTIALKIGAQVMFQRNDPDRKYVNGTIGTVTYLDDLNIEVEINENGKIETVDVLSEIWENKKYKINTEENQKLDQEIIGRFIQFPLKLAWAITIHKSQGKTFNNVIIDMGSGAFTHGMTYVALSRCRSLEGIVLNTPIKPKDIMVDPIIVDFLDQIKRN